MAMYGGNRWEGDDEGGGRRRSRGGGARGRGGGFAARFATMGDNPFTWSLPLGRVAGIRVRVHLMYVLWLAIELAVAASAGADTLRWKALTLGSLFVLVLLHEFGHCFACRWVGGTADDILMWPLGGLAFCRPPHRWKASLITTLGGPMVNVVLLPVFGGALLAVTGSWDAVVFNPFAPGAAGNDAFLSAGWAGLVLWALHYANAALLAFNMLVPMFPMDCGRVVQELLWWRIGYRRSMQVAVTLGLVVASVMAVTSFVTDQPLLLAVAVFGGVTCWVERARLRYLATDDAWGPGVVWEGAGGGATGLGGSRDPEEPDVEWAHLKAKASARQEQAKRDAELDRLLDKIRVKGMGSLSKAERQWLEDDRARRTGKG